MMTISRQGFCSQKYFISLVFESLLYDTGTSSPETLLQQKAVQKCQVNDNFLRKIQRL